jgi:hypothetical protein
MSATTKLFGGGVPTQPEVESLIKRFGVPAVGTSILYVDIAATIGHPVRSNRYLAVVSRWRKRLFQQHNLLLDPIHGESYTVCNNSQRISHSTGKYKSGLRHIRRASEVAARTDTEGLLPDEMRARDHIVKTGNALQLAAATAARQLKYVAPGLPQST